MQKEELVSLGVNWCLTTRKKRIRRSDILEVIGYFNDKDLFPLFFILLEIEYVLDKYEEYEEVR